LFSSYIADIIAAARREKKNPTHKINHQVNHHKGNKTNANNYSNNPYILPVGGKMFFTKMKIAFSGLNLILFRTTYTNWPTVRSAGTKYLQSTKNDTP